MSARDVVTASAVSLVLCVGVVLVADGLHTPKPPPQPTAAQAFAAGQPPATSTPPQPDPAADLLARFQLLQQPILAPATPTRVRIPAIHVDAPLTGLALDANRHLAAPSERDRNLAGWYSDGTSPGVVGTAVIAGHVDTH